MKLSKHRLMWERKQTELWERLYQVTGEVVAFTASLPEDSGAIVREELMRSAMGIGKYIVRSTASATEKEYIGYLEEARLLAIESDYWLRLSHTLFSSDALHLEISAMLSQYAALIDLLSKMKNHIEKEHDERVHMAGPRVVL